jgi:type I restriction enzyme S subunit
VKLPAHARYKSSGVEWLGDLPEHWGVKRLKYLTEISTSGVWGEDPDSENDGCPVATTANISPQGEIDVPGMHRRLLSKAELRKGLCRPGDTIVVKSSGSASSVISGKCAMVRPEHGEICFSNFTLRVRSIEGRLDPFFTWSFLSSGIVRAQVRLMVSTTTYPNLQVPEYISFLVPQPPPAEQRSIAAFLDREMGRVDRLVAKKRELIERLKEKRTALISRTVTRGLPPAAARVAGLPANPPLKPSGIEWIGDIPKHWDVVAYKRVCIRVDVGIAEAATHAYCDDGVPIIRSTNVKPNKLDTSDVLRIEPWFAAKNRSKTLRAGDLVTVRTGYPGTTAAVPPEFDGCQCFTLVLSTPKRTAHGPFFSWVLNSNPGASYFEMEGWGTAQTNISVPIVRFMPVPRPPLPEQVAIVAYLDEETAKLDALVGKVEEAVERLQEYRTVLITAAVTGKIDVRGSVDVRPGKKVTSASP